MGQQGGAICMSKAGSAAAGHSQNLIGGTDVGALWVATAIGRLIGRTDGGALWAAAVIVRP